MLGLKSFHVVFICASILLCLAVGLWGFEQHRTMGSAIGLATAVVFFVSGGLLVVYAVRYFGKLRRLE